MEASKIVQRARQLQQDRKIIEQQWQAIERFILPYRGAFFKDERSENSIEWSRREVYDSTAVMACQSLAASIHAAMTPVSMRWFNARWRTELLHTDREARIWLDDCIEILYNEITKSNFTTEAGEYYLDLVGFGTSAMTLEEMTEDTGEYDGLEFTTVPIKEVYFEMGYNSEVRRFYRVLQWTPLQILDKFGDDCPSGIREKAENPKGSLDKIDVVFCVYKRDDVAEANLGSILPPERRPYGYRYALAENGEALGAEGGYYEMPAFVSRLMRTSSSMWGNSPSMIALGDVLTLNQLVKTILIAAEKAVDPPVVTTERGLLGDLDLNAAGINVVRDMGDLQPFNTAARFDVSQLRVEDLRRAIRSYFHVDQLELKDSPSMTATEVAVRYELMQRHLSPIVGHIQEEFLDRLIERAFNILYRARQFPELPDVLKRNVSEIDIEYTGPLSRAQRMDAVVNVERFIQSAGAMAQINPEVLDAVDFDDAVAFLAKQLSVPSSLLKSEMEVSKVRKDRKAQQQQAMQLQAQQVQADTAEAAGKGAQAAAKAQATANAVPGAA